MITLPYPPSINHYLRHVGHKVLISAEGRKYRQAVDVLSLSQAWPKFGDARLSVTIYASMPDRRRRDLDNILKPLLDALTHAGVWADDSQIDGLSIFRTPAIGEGVGVEISRLDFVQTVPMSYQEGDK
jgi:crossover junction endodeoxyribonuclease RusA